MCLTRLIAHCSQYHYMFNSFPQLSAMIRWVQNEKLLKCRPPPAFWCCLWLSQLLGSGKWFLGAEQHCTCMSRTTIGRRVCRTHFTAFQGRKQKTRRSQAVKQRGTSLSVTSIKWGWIYTEVTEKWNMVLSAITLLHSRCPFPYHLRAVSRNASGHLC